MSIEAITIPKWGMTMTEGLLAEWLVAVGDRIERGQEIMEVESTKTANVVESPVSGIVRRIVVPEGDTAAVGALVAVVADDGVSDEEIDAFIAQFASANKQQGGEESGAVTSRKIDVGDGKVINALAIGPESDSTVVLLHGFGGDLSTWMFNQDAFANSYRVVALDLPGHGASTPISEGNVLDSLVDAVEKAVDSFAKGKLHLVAHSFGGAVAAALVARKGQTVASISLLAPVGLSATINKSFLDDFVAAERRRPLKEVLERLFADPSKISNDMVEATLQFKRLEGVPQALEAIKDLIANEQGQVQSIGVTLREFNGPVQLIWGDRDQVVPVPAPSEVPQNATLTTLPDVGHMPQMESTTEVNRLVLENIAKAK
ncbi:acetoin dehydrogenase dihydrolipoyllysine-residue acetyltransferase subunit [Pseudomonas fluorescens]|uniref:acetoin dehydrogenase dihydrolipoyllysine-residue acetyltransferase subunit n=1 Tax=Pseudomonas fluorescens TaxID=294 RepID=UPI0010EBDB88|nr:acetoin dehydrogenase dihydrolipoyllysine-residue acetyltransferase subunit [Pseudomonas fluorescens]TCV66242.1 pyruvate dehydrogenase E2 component (dihydrolipoamide acetyltransferase) [Pseudomonas fluorescens]